MSGFIGEAPGEESGAASLWPRLGLAAAVLLLALAHVPELVNPPWMDQGLFEVIARELDAGKRLYTDVMEIKPPGIFWAFRIVRWTLGGSHQAVVWADFLVVAATMLLVQKALEGRLPARAVALGLALWGMATWLYPFAGNPAMLETEVLENLLVAATLYLCVRARTGPVPLGLLAALGALVKVLPAGIILAVGALAAGQAPRERFRLACGAAAFAAAAVLCWIASLWLGGTLEDAREALFLVTHQSEIWRISPLGYAPDLGVLVPLALLGLLVWDGASVGQTSVRPSLAAWWILAAVQIALQGRYFGYHFAALIPPAAVLAGIALDAGLTRFPVGGRALALAALLLQALLSVQSQRVFNASAIAFELGQITRDAFESRVHPTWGLTTAEIRAAADQVRKLSRPGDPVFILGVVPQLYLWADRPLYGRYMFHYFLLVDSPLSPAPEALARRQDRFWSAFRSAPPPIVVIPEAQGDVPGLLQNSHELASFPRLADALDRDYTLQRVGPLNIYVRAPSIPTSTAPR